MVKRLQHQEQKFKILMLQLRMGQKPEPQNKKYAKLNEKLMAFVEDYESNKISSKEYVQSVGCNLHKKAYRQSPKLYKGGENIWRYVYLRYIIHCEVK